MSAIGLSLPATALLRRGRVGLLAETQALLGRMAAGPGPARILLISTLIQALKAAGVWEKLDALYVLAAHDAQAARLNWIADRFNLTAVNTPVFVVDQGYSGNGTTSYLNTGFIPSTASGKYAQSHASFGIWSRTDTSLDAALGGSENTFIYKYGVGAAQFVVGINQVAGPSVLVNVTSATGLFSLSRVTAGELVWYQNGSRRIAVTFASTALESRPLYLLARSGSWFQPTSRQISAAFVGAGLSDAEMAALHAAVRTYLIGVGAVAA